MTATVRQEAEGAAPAVDEVAPGMLRLQLPIAMPGLGHVNCYALEDERGFALVDPGLPGPAAWRALVARLRSAGVPLRRVHTVVVTHSHPDHFGGAGRLRVEAGAEVVGAANFRTWWDPSADDGGVAPWRSPAPWGGDPLKLPLRVKLAYARPLRPVVRRWFPTPAPTVRLEDAEVIRLAGREWVAVHTPGHTPDHLCLHDPAEGVLLSGDHVLPTITPHISGLDAGDDPLSAFFGSLDKVSALRGVRRVLPAHGHPFDDLAGRAAAIRGHHAERLDRLRGHVGDLGDGDVVALSERLFPQRAWGRMAQSETYAHLEHLRRAGSITRTEGADGYPRYHPAE